MKIFVLGDQSSAAWMQSIVWLGDFFFMLYNVGLDYGGNINHIYFQLVTWQRVAIFTKSAAIFQSPPHYWLQCSWQQFARDKCETAAQDRKWWKLCHNEWGVLALTEPGCRVDLLHPSCLDCERQRLFSAHQSCTETIWGALFRNLQLYTLPFFPNSVILEGYTWQVVFSSLFLTLCQLVTIYWVDWVAMEKQLIAFTKSSC